MGALFMLKPSTTALRSLREWAEIESNYYDPLSGIIPGDHKPFVRQIFISDHHGQANCYRVVFTITKAAHKDTGEIHLMRHASISKNGRVELPEQGPVLLICHELGFEGHFTQWMIGQHPQDENVLVVAQEKKDGSRREEVLGR